MNGDVSVRTFEDLEAWQKCREVRKFASRVARDLPLDEKFRLADQILRSSRSTTANVAEGYGRFYYQDNLKFCRQARGSLYEVLDHFITGNDEGIIIDEDLYVLRKLFLDAVQVLSGYINYLDRSSKARKA